MEEIFETSFKPGDEIDIVAQLYKLTESKTQWLRTKEDPVEFRQALAKLQFLSPGAVAELNSLTGDQFESKLSEILSRPL